MSFNKELTALREWARKEYLTHTNVDGEETRAVPLGQLLGRLDALEAEYKDEQRAAAPAKKSSKRRSGRRKPDYTLAAAIRGSERRASSLGAAWLQDDDSITLRLDPCVMLNGSDDDLFLRLFPNTKGIRNDDEDEEPF
jgi:hypothetical protein